MGSMGKGMADLVGPPDEEADETMPDDEGAEGEKGGQEEAKVSAAKDFQGAVMKGTPEEVVEALETLLDLVG